MDADLYFIQIAQVISSQSKDPSTKVGAVLVDPDKRIVSTGYNGFVAGCNEEEMTWERPMKYHLVIHAELNAALYARRDLNGCTMYITDAPCDACLKHLLQVGVRKIVYWRSDVMAKRSSLDQKEAIARLLKATGAAVTNINGKNYIEELYV